MKKKVFSLMMTLLLAFMGVAKADVVTIGDGTGTSYYAPFNSLWGYSFVEQVYTASEIGTAGTISAISFNMSSTDSQTNQVDVFMKNVTRSNFSGNTDWETVTANDMVFSGTVTFNNGWTTITLDTPFEYDGTSNLMIGMHEYTSGYSTRYFYYTSVTGGLISGHSDSVNPDPYNMGSFTGSTYVQNYRANIQIDITPGGGAGLVATDLTVSDGTITNGYVPVYGYYADSYLKAEMVYPATDLADMNGTEINAIKFYANNDNVSWCNSSTCPIFKVFLTEVSNTTINAFNGIDGSTLVYEGELSIEGGEMIINFDTPYTYNGGNLLVGVYNTVKGTYVASTWYGTEVTAASVYNYSYTSLEAITTANVCNFLPKATFTYMAQGDPTPQPGWQRLVALQDEVVVDTIKVGPRPNGVWMEPFRFQLRNNGDPLNLTNLDWTPEEYFTLVAPELPVPMATNEVIDVDLATGTTNLTEWQFVALYEETRTARIWTMTAEPYDPQCPDVWELACTEATTFPFVETPVEAHDGVVLHDNYNMPFTDEPYNIPDGLDAVYKLVFDGDMVLNAEVSEGENGKVALYTEDFYGEGGPMADNYYIGDITTVATTGGGAAGGAFEAVIGSETSTTSTSYVPYYQLYYNSLSEALYLASELTTAGVTTSPMTSLSFYANSDADYEAHGIQIWMGNTNDVELTTTDLGTSGLTLVYSGNKQPVTGWNQFAFNQGTFAWDGHSNIVVYTLRNDSEWHSGPAWKAESTSFYGAAYLYSDSPLGTTLSRTYSRPIVKMASGSRNHRDMYAYDFEGGMSGWTSIDNGEGNGWFHSSLSQTYSCYDYTGWGNNDSDGFAVSQSYTDCTYDSYDADNYLVSPQQYAIGNGASVDFWFDYANDSYPDYFEVCVATAANPTANDFTAIWNVDMRGNAAKSAVRHMDNRYQNWRNVNVDLSAYAGQQVWVAFHHQDYDNYELFIDDVTINAGAGGSGSGNTPAGVNADFAAGPVIEGMPVVPGTYYLVASSTDEDFEVTINAEPMPCPDLTTTDYYTFGASPADDADGLQVNNVVLQWNVPTYATKWRLVFGSTYHPQLDHQQTVIYPQATEDDPQPWCTDMSQHSVNVSNMTTLWHNTNYFWHVEFTNGSCDEVVSSPILGFTTTFVAPTSLTATPDEIFEGETTTLSWNGIVDRTYRHYNIYKDGELIHSTANTPNPELNRTWVVPASELAYNMAGYAFQVSAVYDEGESALSDPAIVKVSGYSNNNGINGYVYEQDGFTPIGGVTVTVTGTDEFGNTVNHSAVTNMQGHYVIAPVEVGTYTYAIATCPGYQDNDQPYQNGPTFSIVYQGQHDDMNFILDEMFYPAVNVCAETVEVDGEELVKVWWDFNANGAPACEAFETQIGYGTNSMGYVPMYYLYDNSVSTQIFRADELEAAGVTCAPMSSLSWYSDATGNYNIQNISIWMANVEQSTASSTSPVGSDMTLVFQGNKQVVPGWNEFTFNQEEFAWDLESNVLIMVQMNNGDWGSGLYWQIHNPGFASTSYIYRDNTPYNVGTTAVTGMTVSSQYRANTIFKAGERSAVVDRDQERAMWHYRIYRTDCYYDGPYYEGDPGGTVVLASAWVPDTAYFDVSWPQAAPGVYKWGVGVVYQGNQADNPNNPRDGHVNGDRTGLTPITVETLPGASINVNTEALASAMREANAYGMCVFEGIEPEGFLNFDVNNLAGATVISSLAVVGGSAYDPANGHIYVSDYDNYMVYELDPTTGEIVNSVDTDYPLQTIAMDPTTGNVYGVDNYNYLTIVDPTTGDLNDVGYMSETIRSIAFDANGQLYGLIPGWPASLCTIDKADASQNVLGEMDADANYAQSIGIDQNTGKCYWAQLSDIDDMHLYEINLTTLALTELASNTGEITGLTFASTNTPAPSANECNNLLALPRESCTVWSNTCSPCIDKDMEIEGVTVNVVLNSADDPRGTVVTFTNNHEMEQLYHPIDPIVLDSTGYYAFETFRRGTYTIRVEHTPEFEAYVPIEEVRTINEAVDLRYVMEEIHYVVKNLYVSRTGWAMWEPMHPSLLLNEGGDSPVNPTPGPGTEFSFGFEEDPIANGWTIQQLNATTWVRTETTTFSAVPHEGQYQMWLHWAYGDQDEWLITPEFVVPANANLSFWTYGQMGSTYGDHYYTKISTDGGTTWTELWDASAQPNAENHYASAINIDLSAYAGQNVKLAWQGYAIDGLWYAWCIDDITVAAGREIISFDGRQWFRQPVVATTPATTGSFCKAGDVIRSGEQERHLEYYKVMCTSIDGQPIFNLDTYHPFCQLNTNLLEEGEHYVCHVAAVYSTGMSDYISAEWEYESCENYPGTVNGVTYENNTITWDYPGSNPNPGPGPGPGPQPGNNAIVVLNTPTDIWGDGSGYQMFLDAEHNVVGDLPTGNFGGSIPAATVAEFEYSIPANADGNISGTNVISAAGTNNGTVTVPAGTYDILTVNPDGSNVWVVGNGGQYTGLIDDIVLEAGKTYTFTIVGTTSGDGLNLVVTDSRGNVTYTIGAATSVNVSNCRRSGMTAVINDVTTAPAQSVTVPADRAMWDLLGTFNAAEAAQYGIATDGQYLYTSNWGYGSAAHQFYKYDLSGNVIEGFEIAGCGTFRGIAYDGQYFYGVANSSTVYCVDLANHTLVSQFNSAYGAMRGITYDPVRDGFWVIGNWSGNLTLISRTGAIVQVGPEPSSASDLAYYKDDNNVEHVLVYCQPTANGSAAVYDYDIAGNTLSAAPIFDVYANLPGGDGGSSGGAFVGPYNGVTAFFANMQVSPNHIGIFELSANATPTPTPTPVEVEGILGAMIFVDGEWEAFVEAPTNTYTYEGDGEEICVRIVYDGDAILPSNNYYYAMSCEECASVEPTPQTCDAAYPLNAEVLGETDQVHLWWGEEPVGPVPGETYFYDFEDGYQGWTAVNNDNDTYSWMLASELFSDAAGHGNNSSNDFVCAFSYVSQMEFDADNYLISPQAYTIGNGTLLSFYHDYMDYNYVDYMEVCVATTAGTPTPADFTPIWNNGGSRMGNAGAKNGGLNTRIDAWSLATIDLSAYAGQNVWIAFHHKANNQYMVFVDDVTIGGRSQAIRAEITGFNVYRSTDNENYTLIGNVPVNATNYYEFFDAPGVGNYYYQVTTVYDDGCESAPATSAVDPTLNYVYVGVTGLDEINSNVALFPNPTNGNVTIQANGMRHITVVSVLGQVVYDNAVKADEFTLNMAQFNAGVYMVRIATENGVVVKRVTVMQ